MLASMPSAPGKGANSSLADRAYDAIKKEIIQCRLRPGARVSEAQLTATTGHGKAAVRAALQRLAHEGLVIAVPRQGYQISTVTAQDVIDLFDVRLLLEPAAARMATGHVDEQELRELDRLCDIGYHPDDPDSVERFQRVNSEFHLLIARAAGNPRLTRFLASVLEEMHRLYYLGLTLSRPNDPAHEQGHRDLVEALAAGDADRAERVAREGVLEAKRNCVDALLTLPSMRSAQL